MTTVPGSASACSRAARFGVSPATPARRGPFTEKIADRDESGGDPDPTRERIHFGAERRSITRQSPGPRGRPLGLILVGLWPAKISEYAVAHELRRMAFEARNLAPDGVLMAADRLAPRPRDRAPPRAPSIRPMDEHDGQLAALCLSRRRGEGFPGAPLVRAKRGNRLQQLLAWAERKSDLLELASLSSGRTFRSILFSRKIGS